MIHQTRFSIREDFLFPYHNASLPRYIWGKQPLEMVPVNIIHASFMFDVYDDEPAIKQRRANISCVVVCGGCKIALGHLDQSEAYDIS